MPIRRVGKPKKFAHAIAFESFLIPVKLAERTLLKMAEEQEVYKILNPTFIVNRLFFSVDEASI